MRPEPIGGDRTSHRIEAHAARILGWVDDNKDITIKEIREKLADEGTPFSHGAVWRLLDRHDYTLKNVWPAPLASRLLIALFGHAQTYPA